MIRLGERITHVLVIRPMGAREILSLDSYMEAPAAYLDATHVMLLGRSALIKARAERLRRG